MKTAGVILVIVLALAIGFYIGRLSVEVSENTTVEYRDLPPVHVSIEAPEPLRFTVPGFPQWLYFTDTVTQQQVIDTAAIIEDWMLAREYGGRLISDTTGTIDYFATVQYNRLQNIMLDYTPIQRTVITTQTIHDRFIPFVLVGANSVGGVQVEGGVLLNRFAFSMELGAGAPGKYVGAKVGLRF
jgi:hypothetical protein